MKVGFSTIGCPHLSLEEIVSLAKKYSFSNVELQAVKGNSYLPDVWEFKDENIKETFLYLRKSRVSVACLTSRCNLEDGSEYLEQAKKYISIAKKMKIPFVRVLGDAMPEPGGANTDLVFNILCSLNELSRDTGVMPLIETNGVYANSLFLKQIFEEGNFKNIGVLWDIHHPYVYYKEDPGYTYSNLQNYIKYMHIKDSVVQDNKIIYVPVGEGNVPVKECVRLVKAGGFKGPYTLEWVKNTHPEMEALENVLFQYKNFINSIK